MYNLEQGDTLKSLERELYEIKRFVEETPVNYVLSSWFKGSQQSSFGGEQQVAIYSLDFMFKLLCGRVPVFQKSDFLKDHAFLFSYVGKID